MRIKTFSIMCVDRFGEKETRVHQFEDFQEAKEFFAGLLEMESENRSHFKVSAADKIKTIQNLIKNLNKIEKNKMSSKNIQARFEYFLGDSNERV